jgi:hypothetical protein
MDAHCGISKKFMENRANKSNESNYTKDEKSPSFIEDVRTNHLKKYIVLNSIYEIRRNLNPHYIKRTKKKQKVLSNTFSELGNMYFKLSKENKKKVKRPIHPHDPYLKLTKNNKTFYKLRGELTKEDELLIPPPPPAPNASEEEIQKAKKAYKGWKKRTRNHIPSPPPPRNHLDQVIKMAKKPFIK